MTMMKKTIVFLNLGEKPAQIDPSTLSGAEPVRALVS
jgi:hypothetical protein